MFSLNHLLLFVFDCFEFMTIFFILKITFVHNDETATSNQDSQFFLCKPSKRTKIPNDNQYFPTNEKYH